MSFILDALRKSETERQQQAGGEFSSVPSNSGESQSPKWLWMLALLLLVNIAVLLGILLQPDAAPDAEAPEATTPPPAETQPVETEPVPQEASAEPSFEDRVAEIRESQPPEPAAEVSAEPAAEEPAAAAATEPSPAIVVPPGNQERLLTLDELRLAGSTRLPELHLDIHVYADDPAERFVFVNMNKHREGSQLEEGPTVSEITPEGVVLQHQGRRFLLPRE